MRGLVLADIKHLHFHNTLLSLYYIVSAVAEMMMQTQHITTHHPNHMVRCQDSSSAREVKLMMLPIAKFKS